ncbi:MAG: hypothetical protein ACD_79C00352G0003 [uncultured bacterium]|nr:MAG: hypothetical protein ACD_79C00352G0003 [uncultured bacterium]
MAIEPVANFGNADSLKQTELKTKTILEAGQNLNKPQEVEEESKETEKTSDNSSQAKKLIQNVQGVTREEDKGEVLDVLG